jgi:hypothetical protein
MIIMLEKSFNPSRFVRVFTFLACVGLASATIAQTTIGLAPGMVVQNFKPGQPFQIEIAVSNGTSAPIQMRGTVTDFWYNERNEKTFDPTSSSPQSAASWMEVVPRTFTVQPKSDFKVKVIVTPPANVSPGGHYAAVFIESKPELTQAATAERKAVFTNMKLGSLVLLNAENTATYDVTVANAVLTPPNSSRGLKVDVLLENKSNTHIFPQVQLAVLNEKNELIAKAQGEIRRFLPLQKDHVSVTWDGQLPAGNYNAILTLIYGDGKVRTQDFKFKVPS